MIISVFDRVENIVEGGENAGYQHFLLFQQCFKEASLPDTSKGVIVWEWVKLGCQSLNLLSEQNILFHKPCILTHSHTMTPLDAPGKQAF